MLGRSVELVNTEGETQKRGSCLPLMVAVVISWLVICIVVSALVR